MINGFRDNLGRWWSIELDASLLERVRGLGIDLARSADPTSDVWDRLAADPALLVSVLFAICARQAAERGVEPEDFGRSLTGSDPLLRAAEALTRAMPRLFSGKTARHLRRVQSIIDKKNRELSPVWAR